MFVLIRIHFHAESKYDKENLNFENVWKMLKVFCLSSALDIHVQRVKMVHRKYLIQRIKSVAIFKIMNSRKRQIEINK